jgi:hypothetical protein
MKRFHKSFEGYGGTNILIGDPFLYLQGGKYHRYSKQCAESEHKREIRACKGQISFDAALKKK